MSEALTVGARILKQNIRFHFGFTNLSEQLKTKLIRTGTLNYIDLCGLLQPLPLVSVVGTVVSWHLHGLFVY